MSSFAIVMLIVALALFYYFFQQIASGNHRKRGVDLQGPEGDPKPVTEAYNYLRPEKQQTQRVDELLHRAKNALDDGDYLEARKALDAALYHEPKNTDVLRMLMHIEMEDACYLEAIERGMRILEIDSGDDLACNLLANALAKEGRYEEAVEMHKKAISLDSTYASHFFNYANTLTDMDQKEEALLHYKRALELNPDLLEAKQMIDRLQNLREDKLS